MDRQNGGAEDKNEAIKALQRDLEECQRERDRQKLRADELEKEADALKAKVADQEENIQALKRDLPESLRERDEEKLRADELAEKNSSLEKEVDALKAEVSTKDQLNKKQQDALKDELEELKNSFSEISLKLEAELASRPADQEENIQALKRDLAESQRERDEEKLRADELAEKNSSLEKEVDALKDKQEELKNSFSEISLKLEAELASRPADQEENIQALKRDLAESQRERDEEKIRADELAEKNSSLEKELDVLKAGVSTKDQLNKKQQDPFKDKLKKIKNSFPEISLKHKAELASRPADQEENIQALKRDLAESQRERDEEKLRADELAEKNSSLEKELDVLKDELQEVKNSSEISLKLEAEFASRPADQEENIQALKRDLAESQRERDEEKLRADELAEINSSLKKEVDALKAGVSTKDQLNKKQQDPFKDKLKKIKNSFPEISLKHKAELASRPADQENIQALKRDLAESQRERDEEKLRADELAEKNSSLEKEVDALKDELQEVKNSFSEISLKLEAEFTSRPADQEENIQALKRDLAESLRERDEEKLRADELAEKNSSLEKEVDALKAEVSTKDQLNKKQQDALKDELEELKNSFSEISLKLEAELASRPADQENIQALKRDLAESQRERDEEKLRADELAEKNSSLEKEVDALKDELEELKISFSEQEHKYRTETSCTLRDQRECLKLLKRDLVESERERDLEKLRADELAEKMSSLKKQHKKELDVLKDELMEKNIEAEHHMKSVDDLRKDIEEAKELFTESENISVFRRAKKFFTPNSRRQFKLQMKIDKLGQE